MRLGATGLLGTIIIAFVVHIALGQFRADLLVYAAVVAFVAVFGFRLRPFVQAGIALLLMLALSLAEATYDRRFGEAAL